MEAVGVKTIKDLAAADLYSILKLRGFDYPGRTAPEVPNICFLRAFSVAFVEKCSIKYTPNSFFHKKSFQRIGRPLSEQAYSICGRGGDSKPCVSGDWDGCTPIPGVSVVDVYGLGDVIVPQVTLNISSAIEEIFCRQVPGNRYMSAAAFIENKVVILGGIGNNATHLYRDVWTRDEIFPQAVIKMSPENRSPQSKFIFDSNEAGAHVFEYKISRDDKDIIPWTVTTKTRGVDVAWLDDRKGGPGEGWYSLYVRAVDPGGNRDAFFSTQTNVYKWHYVPPIPWVAVAACIIAFLVLVLGGYHEYRRRKRKATLQRFALRRLRRKFKLKSANQEMDREVFPESIPTVVNGDSSLRQTRKSEQFLTSGISPRSHVSLSSCMFQLLVALFRSSFIFCFCSKVSGSATSWSWTNTVSRTRGTPL